METMLVETMQEWLSTLKKKEYGHFIDGDWVYAGAGKYEITNPGNRKQVLGTFWKADSELTNQSVEAANEAFKRWSKIPGPSRAAILLRFADLLQRDEKELAWILSAEQGKPFAESIGEVRRAVKETQFSAGEAFRINGKVLPSERENVQIAVTHKPIGVVAAIAPWNFPVITPIRKICPALAYGCTVVYKPASATPWSAVKLMELFAEAGVPKGVVNLIIGSGTEVGNVLTSHPLVKGISFTGSTFQGLQIQQQAARRLARTQLELGGKNAAIILNYNDPKAIAKQIASAAYGCSGQRCTAISRIIILESVANLFVDALIDELSSIRIGPAWDFDANMGPLVSKEHLDSVMEYVKVGIEEGATLKFGGKLIEDSALSDGNYMEPTLFTNVTQDMRIAREEIFGPVLSVILAKDEDEALEIANDTDYGLASSLFTDNLSLAYRLADDLQTGMVHVNHGTASEPQIPFGGVKQSGFGAYSIGYSNQEFFTEMKVVYTLY